MGAKSGSDGSCGFDRGGARFGGAMRDDPASGRRTVGSNSIPFFELTVSPPHSCDAPAAEDGDSAGTATMEGATGAIAVTIRGYEYFRGL